MFTEPCLPKLDRLLMTLSRELPSFDLLAATRKIRTNDPFEYDLSEANWNRLRAFLAARVEPSVVEKCREIYFG